MKLNIRPVASLAVVAALGFSSLAIAHPGGMGMGPGMGSGMGPGMGMGPMGGMSGPRAMMMADPGAMVEKHLADTKAELKITTQQEGAWQAFANKATQQAADMQAMRGRMQQMHGTAPDLMSQRTEAMKSRVGQMESMTAALRDLYAVLSPEQKALADKQFSMMGGNRWAVAK